MTHVGNPPPTGNAAPGRAGVFVGNSVGMGTGVRVTGGESSVAERMEDEIVRPGPIQ